MLCRSSFHILMLALWVFLGSGLGGLLRFLIAVLFAQRFGEIFPWGTFFINITGSFAIGFFSAFTSPEGRFEVGADARQFVMTGIFGGYTTYSAFSVQTLWLAQRGDWLRAGSYAF